MLFQSQQSQLVTKHIIKRHGSVHWMKKWSHDKVIRKLKTFKTILIIGRNVYFDSCCTRGDWLSASIYQDLCADQCPYLSKLWDHSVDAYVLVLKDATASACPLRRHVEGNRTVIVDLRIHSREFEDVFNTYEDCKKEPMKSEAPCHLSYSSHT